MPPRLGAEAEAIGRIEVGKLTCGKFLVLGLPALLGVHLVLGQRHVPAAQRDDHPPLDDGVVIEASYAPPEEERGYDHAGHYDPERSIYGLGWYPWPPVRTTRGRSRT